jgi:hypothetical protein
LPEQANDAIGGNLRARFVDPLLVDQDFAGQDQPLRPLTRRYDSTVDE